MAERAETTLHMACGKCRWWRRDDDSHDDDELPPFGACHRLPPTFNLKAMKALDDLDVRDTAPEFWCNGWWPNTSSEDWCGEFRPIFDPPCQSGLGTLGMTADDLHELKGRR